VSSTNAQNGKNSTFIFTILRHLRRAKRGANGYKQERARSALSCLVTVMNYSNCRSNEPQEIMKALLCNAFIISWLGLERKAP